MPRYRFPVFSPTGELVDDEEGVDLPDDDTVRKYGESVSRNSCVTSLKDFGWMMQVRHGDRLLASIPFTKPN